MTTTGSISSNTIFRYKCCTYEQASYLAEFQVARAIAGCSQESGIVRSPESAANDFGLLVGRNLEGDETTKFIQLVRSNMNSRTIAPLDVKSLMPRIVHGTAMWGLHLTPQQMKTCQALIIITPKEPKFVALLPVHYLCQWKKSCKEKSADFRTCGPRPLWSLHPLPAFPPSFIPFVFPFSQLGQALADMRDYCTGSAAHWINRYTEYTFVDVPRPEVFDISVLEPDLLSFRRALDEIVVLFQAFDRYSKNFRIRFCDIRPVLGDFKITHLSTEEEIHVEAKILHCRLSYVASTGFLLLQHSQTCLSSSDRAVFTWRAQWDYLYTHVSSELGSKQALFVPRDKIPKTWWNAPLSGETVWLDWPDDHSFQRYLVNTTTNEGLVHGIEEILATNPIKAQEPVPMALLDPANLIEVDTRPEVTQSFFHEEGWDSRGFRRGHGSAAHSELRGETYHMWASEVLLELCRDQERGIVLDLGVTKSISRYWLADYVWSQDDVSNYDQAKEPPYPIYRLDPRTPIVPISFLRLSWRHGLEPWCVRSSAYSAEAIASRPPSLVICDLSPYACARLPHSRFVLPSNILSKVSYGRKFSLEEGRLEQYSVEEEDLLHSILDMFDGSTQATIGLTDRPIETSKYLHYLKDIWEAVVARFADASEDEGVSEV